MSLKLNCPTCGCTEGVGMWGGHAWHCKNCGISLSINDRRFIEQWKAIVKREDVRCPKCKKQVIEPSNALWEKDWFCCRCCRHFKFGGKKTVIAKVKVTQCL